LFLSVADAPAAAELTGGYIEDHIFCATHNCSKASAKAREFEKWRRQNEGDNSAPRMLKNRPAIVPLKTEA
jgi:hypothetical protein